MGLGGGGGGGIGDDGVRKGCWRIKSKGVGRRKFYWTLLFCSIIVGEGTGSVKENGEYNPKLKREEENIPPPSKFPYVAITTPSRSQPNLGVRAARVRTRPTRRKRLFRSQELRPEQFRR